MRFVGSVQIRDMSILTVTDQWKVGALSRSWKVRARNRAECSYMAFGAHLRGQAGPVFAHGYPRQFLAALTGMFLVCLLVVVCYSKGNWLVRILGKSGTNILTRLSAFFLFAIGVQIIWNGLQSGTPQMLAHIGVH
jgi:MarC family integral membrane protein